MSGLFALLFFLSLIALPLSLIKPSLILRKAKATRKQALLIFGGSTVLFFVLLAVTTAPSAPQKEEAGSQIESITLAPTILPTLNPESQRTQTRVVKVIDGDTVNVELEGKAETIRLIGIDAPEKNDPRKPVQCFAIEATNKAKELLSGKTVSLESDATQGDRDKYQRILRYIFLDGTNINKLMLSEGYAHEYTYNLPYKYQSEFKQAEKEAQEAKRGLWADDACVLGSSAVSPTVSSTIQPEGQTPQTNGNFACRGKTKCGEMASCDEAYFYLNTCGVSRLDGDKDGVPCESLCR